MTNMERVRLAPRLSFELAFVLEAEGHCKQNVVRKSKRQPLYPRFAFGLVFFLTLPQPTSFSVFEFACLDNSSEACPAVRATFLLHFIIARFGFGLTFFFDPSKVRSVLMNLFRSCRQHIEARIRRLQPPSRLPIPFVAYSVNSQKLSFPFHGLATCKNSHTSMGLQYVVSIREVLFQKRSPNPYVFTS